MLKRKDEEKILDINATMQGSLVFSEPVNLRITGRFEGTLNTKGNLMIAEKAIVSADIAGEAMVIGGHVTGTIKASRMVTLTPTAIVTADIETPKMVIEEGGIFNGKCKMLQGKLSLSELSEYLSIEEGKIMEWVGNGRIPVEKEGEKLLFDRREMEVWITQHH
ncbi:MAG: polymer-forming cytoskeletal protein [Candidatus Omnitrophota bacterium]